MIWNNSLPRRESFTAKRENWDGEGEDEIGKGRGEGENLKKTEAEVKDTR